MLTGLMLTKIRAAIADPWTKGLVIAAIVLGIIAIVLLLAGCGGETAAGEGCVGTVTKTYTEYHAGVGIQSGSVTIPTGNTRYYIAIDKGDGTYCSKRVDKSEWLGIKEGDTWPA